MPGQPKARIGCPWAQNLWSGQLYWMTPPHPREPRNGGQERKETNSKQWSGCGGQINRAQTMAEWEPQ